MNMDYFEQGLIKHIANVSELREGAIARKNKTMQRFYEGQMQAFEMALEDYRSHLVAIEASIEGELELRRDWERGQL